MDLGTGATSHWSRERLDPVVDGLDDAAAEKEIRDFVNSDGSAMPDIALEEQVLSEASTTDYIGIETTVEEQAPLPASTTDGIDLDTTEQELAEQTTLLPLTTLSEDTADTTMQPDFEQADMTTQRQVDQSITP